MTETLIRVLHELADSARFEAIDVDAITQTGSSAVRRRRWTAGTGLVASVALVGTLGALGLGGTDGQGQELATPPADGAMISWAEGSTLHMAARRDAGWSWTFTVDVGHPIAAYVRTKAGIVFTDGQEVYSYADGHTEALGEIHNPDERLPAWLPLVADTDGSLAVWPSGHEYVVLDQDTGTVTAFPAHDRGMIAAVDNGRVYVVDERGLVSIDVERGVEDVLGPGLPQPIAIENGRVAERTNHNRLLVDGTPVGPTDTQLGRVVFSPDARWVAADVGTAAVVFGVVVFDTETGATVPLPLTDGETQVVDWLDADTLVVLALPHADAGYRLLTCRVSTRACDPVDADPQGAFTLPTGLRYQTDGGS
jgi:hypothetical protein